MLFDRALPVAWSFEIFRKYPAALNPNSTALHMHDLTLFIWREDILPGLAMLLAQCSCGKEVAVLILTKK